MKEGNTLKLGVAESISDSPISIPRERANNCSPYQNSYMQSAAPKIYLSDITYPLDNPIQRSPLLRV